MSTTKVVSTCKEASPSKFMIFLEMIKFEHTVFALPFAYIGALLTEQRFPSGYHLFWITMAMIGARTAAMSLNRLIDRHIDAKNPRTASRALPQGLLRTTEVWLYTVLSLLLLGVAAYQLSPLAVKLFPLVLFALTFYSYTKRFTWLCHFFLGATLGLAPLGAWVAITNELSLATYLLLAGVTCWVAGFDIVYACDDYTFDRLHGIYSIPARFGIASALRIAQVLHVLAPACFAYLGFLLGLGWPYWCSLSIAAGLLYYQHHILSPADLSRSDVAFFQLNGALSLTLFAGTLLTVLLA